MALQIEGNTQLDSGIEVTSLYARTEASLSLDGAYVSAFPAYWVDEAAYLAKKEQVTVLFNLNYQYAYDRAVDGADILAFANEKVKAELEALGYTVTITL